jgi:hypothetical protein
MAKAPAPTPNASVNTGGSNQASVHSVIITAAAELIGVSILAIFADSSDTIGKAAVALMGAWLLLWLMMNASELTSWTSKL